MSTIRIQLLGRYSTYMPGRIIDCDEEVACRLIEKGTAVRVDRPSVIELAVMAPPAERAVEYPRKAHSNGRVSKSPRRDTPRGGAGDADAGEVALPG